MGVKRCLACGKPFSTRPQVPMQSYCSEQACQRERRKLWQKSKREFDVDYQDNHARANKKWRDGHSDYWQQYRDNHPGYVDRNRAGQRKRNASERANVAKEDASAPLSALPAGLYLLTRLDAPEVDQAREWVVRIAVVSANPARDA